MDDVTQMEFEERDQMWHVTLINSAGARRAGDVFAASGLDRYSKIEQVKDHIFALGYQPKRSDAKPDQNLYAFDVQQIESSTAPEDD